MSFICKLCKSTYSKFPINTLKSEALAQSMHWSKKTDAKFFLASTSEIYGDPEISPPRKYWDMLIQNPKVYDGQKDLQNLQLSLMLQLMV